MAPVTFLREDLTARSIVTCAEAVAARDGLWLTAVGLVLVRQQPGSAKGVMFIAIRTKAALPTSRLDVALRTRAPHRPRGFHGGREETRAARRRRRSPCSPPFGRTCRPNSRAWETAMTPFRCRRGEATSSIMVDRPTREARRLRGFRTISTYRTSTSSAAVLRARNYLHPAWRRAWHRRFQRVNGAHEAIVSRVEAAGSMCGICRRGASAAKEQTYQFRASRLSRPALGKPAHSAMLISKSKKYHVSREECPA